jgi:hypothetical protein
MLRRVTKSPDKSVDICLRHIGLSWVMVLPTPIPRNQKASDTQRPQKVDRFLNRSTPSTTQRPPTNP